MGTKNQNTTDHKRILYYVPIIFHTPQELGGLAKPVMEAETKGGNSPKAYIEKAWEYWKKIRQIMKKERLNTPEKCRKLHIYVDGLTAQPFYCKACFDKTGKKHYMDEIESNKIRCSFCGRVVEAVVEELLLKLVKSLIEQGVPEYLIIEKLMEKGAKIHGTESQELLLEEHDMWVNVAKGKRADSRRKTELLQKRDEFIAKVINETLPKGELGLLFIGRDHDVVEELNKLEERGELTSPLKVLYLFKFIYRIGG